ncbi:MAG: FGGY-family carbohydrate kinase [Spirochaetota bacterium]
MNLIGLDVGTTGCKVSVFSPSGELLGFAKKEYGLITDEPGMAEQDLKSVWQITCESLGKAVFDSGIKEARALSISVQGDAIIPIDREFKAIHNAILGMDYRSEKQALRAGEIIGAGKLFRLTGMRAHPLNSLCKIMWLKESKPEIYRRTWKFTTYADFFLARLGDALFIDYTMASRTMGFDLKRKRWSSQILEKLNVDSSLLSPARPSGEVVGEMHRTLRDSLGLKGKVLLVTGGHDQTCAALGAGILNEGRGVISTGTAEVLAAVLDKPLLNTVMFNSFYPCYLNVKKDTYFTFSLNHTGGLLLRWYRDNLACEEIREAEAKGADAYAGILNGLPDGPSPVLILPHFNGSGTPGCDLSSKGAIIGLNLSTTRQEIVLAILESLTYELRINLETLRKAGVRIDELWAVGGGAKSPLWLQIKADILELPVRTLKVKETASLGAAILAGYGGGVFPTLEEGVERMVSHGDTCYPRQGKSVRYRELYAVFKQIYPQLTAVNRRLTKYE